MTIGIAIPGSESGARFDVLWHRWPKEWGRQFLRYRMHAIPLVGGSKRGSTGSSLTFSYCRTYIRKDITQPGLGNFPRDYVRQYQFIPERRVYLVVVGLRAGPAGHVGGDSGVVLLLSSDELIAISTAPVQTSWSEILVAVDGKMEKSDVFSGRFRIAPSSRDVSVHGDITGH